MILDLENFAALNRDCFDHLLGYLSPVYWIRLRRVCRSTKEAVDSHFRFAQVLDLKELVPIYEPRKGFRARHRPDILLSKKRRNIAAIDWLAEYAPHLQNIENVSLRLEQLLKFGRLTTATIRECEDYRTPSSEDLENIRQALLRLESVRIIGPSFPFDVFAGSFENLKSLQIDAGAVPSHGIGLNLAIGDCRKLTTLHIFKSTPLGDTFGAQHWIFRLIERAKKLENLYLSELRLGQELAVHINEGLKYLSITNNRWGAVPVEEVIKILTRCQALDAVSLVGNNFSYAWHQEQLLRPFADALERLKSVETSIHSFYHSFYQGFYALAQMQNLRTLIIYDIHPLVGSLSVINNIRHLKNLSLINVMADASQLLEIQLVLQLEQLHVDISEKGSCQFSCGVALSQNLRVLQLK